MRDHESRFSEAVRIARATAMAVALAAAAEFAAAAGAGNAHTVAMDGTRFVPGTITVKRGDRIVWVNKDPFPHTATARPLFDSESVAAGDSWSFTATRAGEFPYVCTLHPGMKGVLIVK